MVRLSSKLSFTHLHLFVSAHPPPSLSLSSLFFVSGGAFAVGGPLAIEDAYTLSLILSHALSKPYSSSFPPTSRKDLISSALSRYSDLRSSHVQRVVDAANSVRAARERRNNLGSRMTEEEIRKVVWERVETEWIAENDVQEQFGEMLAREERKEEEEGLRR